MLHPFLVLAKEKMSKMSISTERMGERKWDRFFNGTKLGNFLIDENAATKAIKIMESKIKRKNRYISI